MGLLNLFKKESEKRELKIEDFEAAGVIYQAENIKKLACSNPEWKSTCKAIIANGHGGKKIYRYNYIHKPVKLVPEPKNEHDKNAIMVIIAGEHVGYVPSELCSHVKKILNKHEIKYISAFISGGQYKVVLPNGDMNKDDQYLTVKVRIAYV